MVGSRPLVVGIGNDHRGDDAAGLLTVRALRSLIAGNDLAEIVEHRGDGVSLIELWDGWPWVILVDAVRTDTLPGRLIRVDASERAIEVVGEPGSTHAFGPAGAIELARCLGRLPRRVDVFGITGSVFSMGAQAHSAVRVASRAVAIAIAEVIERPVVV